MADAAVEFLLNKIDTVLTREWNLPGRVNSDVRNLKRELEMMAAVLKEADYEREQHSQILTWVKQVQDNARDIEYVLDKIEYDRAAESVSRAHRYRRWENNHAMAKHIEKIKENLQNIKEIRERYPTIKNSSRASSSMSADHLSSRTPCLSEAEIEGIGGDKDMISWAARDMRNKVRFVTGMGGSGKTTLVRQVFDSVKGDFDCHAWVTVSKNAKHDRIFQQLLARLKLSSEQRPSFGSEDDPIIKLHNFLKFRKCLIVLDDLWSKNVWESISNAFPGGNGSRIIITTRRGDIACSRRDNSISVHNVHPLPRDKAEQLFHRTAFPDTGSCPRGLLKWSNDILSKCEGLPLAITKIGQIMSAREQTQDQWKRMHDSLVSELRRNARLSNVAEVLMLSYHDLPNELKYCFLHMNLFPADSPINTRKLIRLWIAEGFIREQIGKELEDVAEEYVKELIERSLIQVYEFNFDGRPKACRIHNIMHAIILSRLQDEAFGVVCSSKELNDNRLEKTQRISIQAEDLKMQWSVEVPHARTLLIFNPRIADASPLRHVRFPSMKLLKVLHLQGFNLHTFPKEIEEFLLLSYLCLRETSIKHVPGFIGKLRYLETLDLKQTMVTKLPKEINNLQRLRHLLVYRYDMGRHVAFDSVKGFEFSADIRALTNLQKLSFVTAPGHQKLIQRVRGSRDTIQMLRHLKNLRKLGIISLSKKDGKDLCESIQCLDKLYSLNLTSMPEEILDIQEISHPPRLQRLYLKGKLERMPSWISKLNDLVRLRLKWSRLPASCNPIEELEDLPNLLELQLLDAYAGNQLDFNAGKFQKLKILEFEKLEELICVIMEDGTLPCLQKLIIRQCNKLSSVPVGIQNLSIKELILSDMPEDFVTHIRRGGSMRDLVQHIAIICSSAPNKWKNFMRESSSHIQSPPCFKTKEERSGTPKNKMEKIHCKHGDSSYSI